MERNGRSFACANLFCFFFMEFRFGNGGQSRSCLDERFNVFNVSCSFGFFAAVMHRVYTRLTIAEYHPFTIQLSFIINVIHDRISLQVACQEFISSENDYLVCIQNSGFCQLCPRLHRVFRLRMCMPSRARGATPDLVLNASLNLTVGGRRCFSYIKVAVSHGKLQLWGFKAETASILLQGFARLVNFCDKSRSVFLSPSYLTSPLSSYFSCTISMIRRNYG